MTLLETVIADLRSQAGNKIAEELADMVERGFIEPVIKDGEYGFRATDLGAAMLDARRARKH